MHDARHEPSCRKPGCLRELGRHRTVGRDGCSATAGSPASLSRPRRGVLHNGCRRGSGHGCRQRPDHRRTSIDLPFEGESTRHRGRIWQGPTGHRPQADRTSIAAGSGLEHPPRAARRGRPCRRSTGRSPRRRGAACDPDDGRDDPFDGPSDDLVDACSSNDRFVDGAPRRCRSGLLAHGPIFDRSSIDPRDAPLVDGRSGSPRDPHVSRCGAGSRTPASSSRASFGSANSSSTSSSSPSSSTQSSSRPSSTPRSARAPGHHHRQPRRANHLSRRVHP